MNRNQTPPAATEAEALASSLKLVLIAMVSAGVTAALVITLGGAWLDRSRHPGPSPDAFVSEMDGPR